MTGDLLACGYSFGACSAVRTAARSERVTRLLLVSPPPTLLDTASLRAFQGPVLVAVGEADELAPPAALSALLEDRPGVHLEIIPASDHFFLTGLAELGQQARVWLSG